MAVVNEADFDFLPNLLESNRSEQKDEVEDFLKKVVEKIDAQLIKYHENNLSSEEEVLSYNSWANNRDAVHFLSLRQYTSDIPSFKQAFLDKVYKTVSSNWDAVCKTINPPISQDVFLSHIEKIKKYPDFRLSVKAVQLHSLSVPTRPFGLCYLFAMLPNTLPLNFRIFLQYHGGLESNDSGKVLYTDEQVIATYKEFFSKENKELTRIYLEYSK